MGETAQALYWIACIYLFPLIFAESRGLDNCGWRGLRTEKQTRLENAAQSSGHHRYMGMARLAIA